MKRILPLLIAFVLIAVGCAPEEEKPATVTPEEFYAKMCLTIISGGMTPIEAYDNYFALVSKALVEANDYRDGFSQWQKQNEADGIIYTGITDVTATPIDGDMYAVTAKLCYTENGEEKFMPVKDFLATEDGQYKYLYQGIISKRGFTMPEEASHQPLHMTSAEIYFTPERTKIVFNMKNDSSSVYSFGKEEGSEIILTTAAGEATTRIDKPMRINSGTEAKFEVWLASSSKNLKTIKICDIYSVDYMGNIIDGGSFDYPIMFQYVKADSSAENSKNEAE